MLKEIAQEEIEEIISSKNSEDEGQENQNESENVKDMVDRGKKHFGKVEKDTFIREDVVCGDNPLTQTTYKANRVTTFEKADQYSFLRIEKDKILQKFLMESYPEEFRNYIFNSKGFEGTLVDYIAESEKMSTKEFIRSISIKDIFGRIPSRLSASNSRKAPQDSWW